jgi:HAMP domain-containing protein
MSKADIVSSVIAAVSAVIAGISLFVAARFARRQTQLQERVTKIEEGRRDEEIEAKRRARVTARIRHADFPYLVLTNHGPAEARSVVFTVSAGSDGNIPAIETELLPITVLHPDVPMSFWLSPVQGDCNVLLVKVTWTGDAGPQEKDFKLSVY